MKIFPKDLGWTPFAWLVYLLFFAIWPFFSEGPQWQRWAALAATLVSVPLYIAGYRVNGRRSAAVSGAFLVLGTLFVQFNPGATTFYIYAATFLSRSGEQKVAFRNLAVLLAVEGLEAWSMHLSPAMWVPIMTFSALLGSVVIHYAQRNLLTGKLLLAQEEAQHMAKMAERERIARDLHDLLGHTLSVIILKSELASRLAEKDPARASAEIRDVERISREALTQVRAAVRGYRAGLEIELREARHALETAGIRVEASLQPPPLSAIQESVFALALREAVTNVVRHAQATVCRLTLRQSGSFCELEIADNGRGGGLEEGSGLSGMRQRVEALGGALERDGSQGTLLRIRVPV